MNIDGGFLTLISSYQIGHFLITVSQRHIFVVRPFLLLIFFVIIEEVMKLLLVRMIQHLTDLVEFWIDIFPVVSTAVDVKIFVGFVGTVQRLLLLIKRFILPVLSFFLLSFLKVFWTLIPFLVVLRPLQADVSRSQQVIIANLFKLLDRPTAES